MWRYELGTWVEEDVPLSERHPFLPEGYDHSPFMTLGDTSPGARGMSVAVHEVSEGHGYLVVVLAGEESMDPIVVSDLPSLLHLLGTLAPIVSASQD
ncbi:MAG TPA: hypothetical protein VK902_03425 [Rubrobacter sp.]|nr:hypothetical protein [Rubrobacter sp.]